MKTANDKSKEKYVLFERIYRVTILVLKICMLFICSFLAMKGIRYSYYSSTNYSERIFELKDSTAAHLFVFAAGCILLGIALIIWNKLKTRMSCKWPIEKGVLLMACIWLMVIGLLYVMEHPYYPVGDQINTTAGAAYARAGNYAMFIRGGYIGLYEQQKGFLFLYEILFTLFGDFCYKVAACFHVLFSVITLVAGYFFLKIVSEKPLYRILYCFMMMFCMPYIIYLPYIYGDLPSICFSMILFWALAAYGKQLQKRYLIIAGIAASLALLVRMNSWIVLIAVGIGMLLLAIEKKTLRPILAGLCIIVISWGTVKSVDKMYEYRSGFESGVGIPSILWVAMGLQETDGNPGIYNRYQQSVYEQCEFQQEPAIQISKEYISSRLEEFKDNPAYARWFFAKKIKMQWLEPLFESLYATSSFQIDEGKEIPDWISHLYYDELHDIAWKTSNYYQSIVYLAMLSFAIDSLLRKKEFLISSMGWVPVIAIVGGFMFSIIWESQCRYVLPYYMYMIIYASVEIGKIAEIICRYYEKMNKKNDSDVVHVASYTDAYTSDKSA